MKMFLPLGALAEDDVGDLQDFLNTYHCAAKYFMGFDGMTLLHYAAQQGSGKITAWLVHPHRGLDLDARNIQGRTALFIAASTGGPGSARVVEILLKAGADPSIPTLIGSTALMVARSAEVMKLLLQYPEKKEEDENDEEVGMTEVTEKSKKRGERGGKQLILLITGGGLDGVMYKYEKDCGEAGTNEKERGLGSCRAYRCGGESDRGGGGREGAPGSDMRWERKGKRMNYETQTPLDIDAMDVNGHTALHHAMFGGRKAYWALPLLLANGANPWVKDRRGRLSIYYLSRYSQPAFIEALLSKAMTSPPPPVWSLCKARAAEEVEEMEEREKEREKGCADGQEVSRPSGVRGVCRTDIRKIMGVSEAELIEEEEAEEEGGKVMAQEERGRGGKGRVACSVEERAKKGNKMPRIVWTGGSMEVKEANEVVKAVVRFVVGGEGGRLRREGGRAVLPTELFAELVEMMDWQGREG